MQYYNLCCRYKGRMVRINDRHGRTHVGRIMNVTQRQVFIQPMQGGRGFGYFGGYGYGYGYGAAYGVALGAITGIALASLFFI
ncbi:hypothetical protein [Priestia endophytica]|jgi:hypothetical protein|uniref:Uncharacterized protein n=1 Tax=Priestia endophytica TaxID=135735 RepID=A0AAX1QE85_9BACI|nr:hypothetical protein [Priestia endophytica]KAB2494423.1 hypothetical protein F8155_07555 [Priestia endophytica]MBG9814444.1 hypothetical protein [Priestia endophytica]MCM3538991.1 hypothetical protein [Priestia endophytica]RAS80035.1 hypothetical protein A4U60_15270 [Priestia endophytica]RAS82177.1 hypothetical protein A3864_01320 [Priestia endophytica]